jgi:protein TonB
MGISFGHNVRAISCCVELRELESDVNSEMKMLERLLESRFKPERSVGGTIASVTGHTALVAAALYATAQTHVRLRPTDDFVHVAYVAQPQPVSATNAAPTVPAAPIKGRRPIFFDVKIPDISTILPIATAPIVASPGDFTRVPMDAGGGGGTTSRSPGATFRADEVEKQVTVLPGGRPPRYPEALRIAGVEGKVVAIFVVDDRGLVEAGSVSFLHSDNEQFEREVRATLRDMRFTPAEVGGRKVRQLVQMPFVFKLSR